MSDKYSPERQGQINEYLKNTANFRENHSLLFLSRIKTTDYVNRLANLYYEHFLSAENIVAFGDYPSIAVNNSIGLKIARYNNTKYPRSFIIEGKEGVRKFIEDFQKQDKETFINFLERNLRELIDYVSSMTLIQYQQLDTQGKFKIVDGIHSSPGTPPLVSPIVFNSRFKDEVGDEKIIYNELSLAEAHELVHSIFNFKFESSVTTRIKSGFEFQTQDDYDQDPNELLARMMQLKNYFGMKASEEFTKDHLLYLRENYATDYGEKAWSQIQEFMNSINENTQSRFLQVINELPI